MGDQPQFSDDISALWGPGDPGILEPAPLSKDADERPEAGEAGRAALLAEILAEVDRRLRASEAGAQQQLYDLAGQVVGAIAGVGERVAGLEQGFAGALAAAGERLGAVERRAALVAEAVEAYRQETVRPAQLDALRRELEAADEEVVARTEAHLTGRLDDLAARLAEVRAATERLAEVDRVIAELARGLEATHAELPADVHAAVDARWHAPTG